ncbi:Nicotinate-nucleotide--dimethylbenzimidazole phosphoribosyltransferase [Clostridiaceae bacterium JG1575]|nr:Nicotinate-nucleotide--dimethylbenzimidazole phosphoribosyltransferase [Clostridiaceae bacterium JG1575]
MQRLQKIQGPDPSALLRAKARHDGLCKPPGSLGVLEDLAARLEAITGSPTPVFQKAVLVFAADNGVFAEGVSQNPQETTWKVCQNILKGRSGLGQMAAFYGVDVFLEDVGVLRDVPGHTRYKVCHGTGNIRRERALSRNEAFRCLLAGAARAREAITCGYNFLGAGEMGVGNTTTSAAVICAMTGASPEEATGYGSGLTLSGYRRKVQVVREALQRHQPFEDALEVLSCLGGADLCAMVGVYLECALHQIPFVLDGIISFAALLCAKALAPEVTAYAIASHQSAEAGARCAQKALGITPFLELSMRLGEGSGCPMAMNVAECALFTLAHMASFEEVQLTRESYIDLRRNEE